MRSDTLTPIASWALALGLDVWRVAQINRNQTGYSRMGDCDCLLERGYQSNRMTRDCITRALQAAEAQFLQWTGTYAARRWLLGSEIDVPLSSTGLDAAYGTFDVLKTRYGVAKPLPVGVKRIRRFGTAALELLDDNVTLTRTDVGGAIVDTFTLSCTVPLGTLASDVRVVFRPTDGGEVPTVTSLGAFIRPLVVSVSGTSASISGPAYLFVKPELTSAYEGVCLPHELTSYVSAVDVYRETVDTTAQGVLVDADGTEYAATFSGTGPFVTAQANSGCGVCSGAYLRLNYEAGYALERGGLRADVLSIIAPLAAALASCDLKPCCENCGLGAVNHYREFGRVQTAEGLAGPTGDQWSPTFTSAQMTGLGGLEPRRGVLLAKQRAQVLLQTEGMMR